MQVQRFRDVIGDSETVPCGDERGREEEGMAVVVVEEEMVVVVEEEEENERGREDKEGVEDRWEESKYKREMMHGHMEKRKRAKAMRHERGEWKREKGRV